MAADPTTAPILGTTADGSASAESARGLLLTVLGELARTGDGGAWTRTLVELLGGVGVKDKAARQALSRMERPAWLERQRQGRSVRWLLGPELMARLETGGSRIYGFGRKPITWDTSWLLLVPGHTPLERSVDFRLARELRWAGCGPGARGTWICPWVNRRSAVVEALEAHGAGEASGASLFEARLAGLGRDAALASEAWDVAALAQQYESFLGQFEQPATRPGQPFTAACELVVLVHQWRKFPLIDPELPTELLPADWVGHRAAALFAARREELLPQAQQWWTESECRA